MSATVVSEDGSVRSLPARTLLPGMRVIVTAGERIPADGIITSGISDVDESLITGETVPRAVTPGTHVHAGTVNGGGTLHIRVTVTDENTLLAEIGRLMLVAEQSRVAMCGSPTELLRFTRLPFTYLDCSHLRAGCCWEVGGRFRSLTPLRY